MSNRGRARLLERIFEDPVRSDIEWEREILPLLRGLGAEIEQGKRGRVWVFLNGVRHVVHPPHPRKEMDKAAVKDLRDFLLSAGVLR